MKESVLSLKEKRQVLLNIFFMTDTLTIIFDCFNIWLLGYRIEFRCL